MTTSRRALHVTALLTTITLAGCQLLIGLDDYYLAPTCPPNAKLCKVCNTPADCDPPTECHTWSCVANLCQPIDAQVGSPCGNGVCNEASPATCVTCNVDEDCPDGGYCWKNECARCDDGIENGDESGVDCSFTGGDPKCPICTGYPCHPTIACKSGFCFDAFCCNGQCDMVCAACNLDGAFGDCSAVPQGQADPNSGCQAGGNACNGGGICAQGNGASCTGPSQCASLKCENNICVP